MLFWEEPVASAFVCACAAALARVEIYHVHDVSVSTKHEFIHLIYSCRCTSCASVDEGTLFRIDRYTARRCKTLSQTMIRTARKEDERTLISFASMLLSDPSGVLTPQRLCAVVRAQAQNQLPSSTRVGE